MTMTIGTWHADRADENGMGSTYTQNPHHRIDQAQQVIYLIRGTTKIISSIGCHLALHGYYSRSIRKIILCLK